VLDCGDARVHEHLRFSYLRGTNKEPVTNHKEFGW
jgi:hypothetical protein